MTSDRPRLWILVGVGGSLLLIGVYDVFQRQQAILDNDPLFGHLRSVFNGLGPKVRQYFVAE